MPGRSELSSLKDLERLLLTVRVNSFAVYGSISSKIRESRGIITSYLKQIQARLEYSRFNLFARYMMIDAARYTGIRDKEQHPSAGLLAVRVNSFAVCGSILTMYDCSTAVRSNAAVVVVLLYNSRSTAAVNHSSLL